MDLTPLLLVAQLATSGTNALTPCEVTIVPAVGFGDDHLKVFAPWPSGQFVFKPGGSGFMTSDGALGIKVGWQRGVHGRLTIERRRIDGAASSLRSEINGG